MKLTRIPRAASVRHDLQPRNPEEILDVPRDDGRRVRQRRRHDEKAHGADALSGPLQRRKDSPVHEREAVIGIRDVQRGAEAAHAPPFRRRLAGQFRARLQLAHGVDGHAQMLSGIRFQE